MGLYANLYVTSTFRKRLSRTFDFLYVGQKLHFYNTLDVGIHIYFYQYFIRYRICDCLLFFIYASQLPYAVSLSVVEVVFLEALVLVCVGHVGRGGLSFCCGVGYMFSVAWPCDEWHFYASADCV